MSLLWSAITGRLKLWLAIAVPIVIGAAVLMILKSGGDAERAKRAQADLKAANTVATERAAARAASDDELDKEIERWTRRSN